MQMLSLSQFSISTVPVLVGVVPPGGRVQLAASGTVEIFLGNSTLTSVSNGYPVGTGGVVFSLPFTSKPGTVYAIAASSTTLGAAFITAS